MIVISVSTPAMFGGVSYCVMILDIQIKRARNAFAAPGALGGTRFARALLAH